MQNKFNLPKVNNKNIWWLFELEPVQNLYSVSDVVFMLCLNGRRPITQNNLKQASHTFLTLFSFQLCQENIVGVNRI